MRNTLIALTLTLVFATTSAAEKLLPHPQIVMETSMGTIRIELDGKEAPMTVAHFVELAEAGFFDGLIFHRVIDGFMIQGGGYTPDFKAREDEATIANESGNKYSNVRGTIAMARTGDPHSANSQFFINLVDNSRLDPQKDVVRGRWGYTVFGYVVSGMEIVDAIAQVEKAPQEGFPDAPVVPIVIKKLTHVTN
ncbi:MAG: peptidylprolyl isomerase [Woeseiaceae bacterium]